MADGIKKLRFFIRCCQRNSNASKVAILYTQSSNGFLACDANNFQISDNHWKHFHKTTVGVPQIVLSIVRRSVPAAILHDRNECGSSNEASSDLAIQIVKSSSHGLGEGKSKAFDLSKYFTTKFFTTNEMNVTQPATIQMHQQLGYSLLVDRNLAGDLDEDQQLLSLGTEFLRFDLVQRDIGRQCCGSVGRLPKPEGDHSKDYSCYNCHKSCPGGPSIPLWNALLAKPPAVTQSIKEFHFLPLLLSGPHSATCPKGVEVANG